MPPTLPRPRPKLGPWPDPRWSAPWQSARSRGSSLTSGGLGIRLILGGRFFGSGASVGVRRRLGGGFTLSLALGIRPTPQIDMLAVDLGQAVQIGRRRCRRLGHAAPFLFRMFASPFIPDTRNEVSLQVQGQHGNLMQPREVEHGQIEFGIESPKPCPVGLAEERLLLKLAGHPAIKDRLHRAGKSLETQDHVGPPAMQRADHRELPAMMLDMGVGLAEHDDRARRRVLDHPVMRLDNLRSSGSTHWPSVAQL